MLTEIKMMYTKVWKLITCHRMHPHWADIECLSTSREKMAEEA